MSEKPRRSLLRRLAFALLALLVIAVGGYVVALKAVKPDPGKLGTWGSDLDKALAEAKKTDRLVLVKAGSEY